MRDPRRRPQRGRRHPTKRKRDSCDLSDCCDLGDLGGPCLIGLFSVGFSMLRPVPRAPSRSTARSTPGAGGPQGLLAALLWRRVRAYQLYVSAHRAPCCPMTPTCSRYSLDALEAHGARRGLLLTVRRLRRCHPGAAGLDPVPAT